GGRSYLGPQVVSIQQELHPKNGIIRIARRGANGGLPGDRSICSGRGHAYIWGSAHSPRTCGQHFDQAEVVAIASGSGVVDRDCGAADRCGVVLSLHPVSVSGASQYLVYETLTWSGSPCNRVIKVISHAQNQGIASRGDQR